MSAIQKIRTSQYLSSILNRSGKGRYKLEGGLELSVLAKEGGPVSLQGLRMLASSLELRFENRILVSVKDLR